MEIEARLRDFGLILERKFSLVVLLLQWIFLLISTFNNYMNATKFFQYNVFECV